MCTAGNRKRAQLRRDERLPRNPQMQSARAKPSANGTATKSTASVGRVPSRSAQYGSRVGEIPFLVAKAWRSGPTPETPAAPRALQPPSNVSLAHCPASRFALTALLAANLRGRTRVKRTPLADGLRSGGAAGNHKVPRRSRFSVVQHEKRCKPRGKDPVPRGLQRKRYCWI